MAYNPNNQFLAALAAGGKNALDGGLIYLFAGSVPADANAALDMAATHTQVAILSLGGDGSTGLTFDSPTDGALIKPAVADWSGLVAFDGAQNGETTLTPTFFRFCATGDNGRSAGTGPRLQGTVGGPSSAANMKLLTSTLTANGSNTTSSDSFRLDLLPTG